MVTRMAKIHLPSFHSDCRAPERFRQGKTYANSKMFFAFLLPFWSMLWVCLQWMLAAGRSSTGKGHRHLLLFATETNSMNQKRRIWLIFEPLKAFRGKWPYRIHTYHQEVSFSHELSGFKQIQPVGRPLDISVWPAQTSMIFEKMVFPDDFQWDAK